MKQIIDRLRQAGRVLLVNAPEGADALLLAEAARASAPVACLHIALDDARMVRLSDLFASFAPDIEVILIPAWDCLPYDRISPRRDILAKRLDGLSRLRRETRAAGRIVLTTVNAALQRVPPRALFEGRSLEARVGESLPPEALTRFFGENGYQRVDTVSEPGEYALRGGIVDCFPPGSTEPLRLDFFGDELEEVRRFDPLTQRSGEKLESLRFEPVSEVILNEDTVARFRSGYRETFGTSGAADPLYEAISAGRLHPGMEHWLPLFYERLETLWDYLPEGIVTLDAQSEEARQARLETIADFYQARHSLESAAEKGEWAYRPLPSDALYLRAEEWSESHAGRPGGLVSPFDAPSDLPGAVGETLDLGGRRARDFAEARLQGGGQVFEAARDFIGDELALGRQVLIAGSTAGSRDRLAHLMHEHGLTEPITLEGGWQRDRLPAERAGLITLNLERGFGLGGLTLVTEQDILGERIGRPVQRRRRSDNFLTEASSLSESDLVVHVEHGIGRYEGLETLQVAGAPHDCLKVIYHGGDRLFVPVENIDVLSRFGSDEGGVELDRLGHGQWQARKAKVKERLREIAGQLMRTAAARALKRIDAMAPPEGAYDEFAARFPYPETEDQLRAIEQTLDDLAEGHPMDRLICGDVGFGKTEVALRAAFVVAMSGRQVAVVAPTTLLARQHLQTFRERFAGLPLRIGQISRLVGAKQAAAVKEGAADGTLDVLIGTHALLSKSVHFKRLGLVIIDEEQHFGVKQKERLKELRADVHVLTLTATPIPRTLQLAMSGLRELSIIATPPVDRLAVRTFVLPFDPVVVREAILREHYRGGQAFYVCPRLEDIPKVEERLRHLVPEVKISVAHGRLAASRLEQVMTAFYERRFDLLLSTNIVESGLDIPTANTLIVHRADMFGLAQLYQLRGRIGRSKQRGYAYFTLPPGRILTAGAEKRLHVMQTLDQLGAGFTLASHDLDIRGAGNLLGEEQSGHVREVGVELYQQMLEETVANLRGEAEGQVSEESWSPQISLGTSVLIPESYVADLDLRLGLYRRLAEIEDQRGMEAFAAELIDRFGPLPPEVDNLLHVMAIKQLCRSAGVAKIDAGPKGAVVSFHNDRFAHPEKLVDFITSQVGTVQLRPDHKLIYRRNWDDDKQRLNGVRHLMGRLAEIAA